VLKKTAKGETVGPLKNITVMELQEAEDAIVGYVQRQCFAEEIN
jgi:hypothetical protein